MEYESTTHNLLLDKMEVGIYREVLLVFRLAVCSQYQQLARKLTHSLLLEGHTLVYHWLAFHNFVREFYSYSKSKLESTRPARGMIIRSKRPWSGVVGRERSSWDGGGPRTNKISSKGDGSGRTHYVRLKDAFGRSTCQNFSKADGGGRRTKADQVCLTSPGPDSNGTSLFHSDFSCFLKIFHHHERRKGF